MRKLLAVLLVIAFTTVGVVAATQAEKATEKKEKKAAAAQEDRWSGMIQRSSKEAKTLTVRRGNIEKTVVYDDATKWTKDKEAADPNEFKDGSRVICLGKYDDKGRLVATRIDLRPPR